MTVPFLETQICLEVKVPASSTTREPCSLCHLDPAVHAQGQVSSEKEHCVGTAAGVYLLFNMLPPVSTLASWVTLVYFF